MIIRKCDLCGAIYDDCGEELVAHIGLWSRGGDEIFSTNESIDCCPRCTDSVSKFLQVLKQGDDFELTVISKED